MLFNELGINFKTAKNTKCVFPSILPFLLEQVMELPIPGMFQLYTQNICRTTEDRYLATQEEPKQPLFSAVSLMKR